MFHRLPFWLAVLGVTVLYGTGCRSLSSPDRDSRSEESSWTRWLPFRAEPNDSEEESIPVEALAHYATGLSHDLNSRPEEALEEYVRAAEADPGHDPLVIETARRLLRSNQAQKAVDLLTKASSETEPSGTRYALLGLAYNQAGQTDRAIDANRKAIKLMPKSLVPYQNLAQIYLLNSKTNEALEVLDQASRERGTDARFCVDLAELYARFSKLSSTNETKAKERAKRALDRASKLAPEDFLTLQKLADGFYQLGELAHAEQVYLQLMKRFPEIPLVRSRLVDIYLRTENKEKLAEQLEAMTREDPTNPRTYSFLGALAMEGDKLEEAARYFEMALKLNPNLEPIYYDLAGLRINLQQPKEALELLGQARARFKLNFILEFYSGIAQVRQKNYKEALVHFTSAEVLAKAGEPARLNHIFYFQAGAAFERSHDYEQAERYFQKCLELSPDFADALNYLGYMWAERGVKLEHAHELIKKAVELEPENAAFLDSMGWVLFKLNQPQEALAWILKAIEHSEEPDATIYDHLGDIYAVLDNWDEAKAAWRKALSVEPNDAIQLKLEKKP